VIPAYSLESIQRRIGFTQADDAALWAARREPPSIER
jgi:hypothetical protein